MSSEIEPHYHPEPSADDHLQSRRNLLARRFRLYVAVTKEIRQAYTRNGATPIQPIHLREPDTRNWRGQIQPVTTRHDGAQGHVVYLRNSLGEERYFANLKFKVFGFTGIIKPGEFDAPLPTHIDGALDILAAQTGYCEWDPVPVNVPYQKIDVRPIIEAAYQVRPDDTPVV